MSEQQVLNRFVTFECDRAIFALKTCILYKMVYAVVLNNKSDDQELVEPP